MKWHNDYDVSIPGWSSEGNHQEPEKDHSCISLQLTISSQQIVQRKLTFLPNFYLLPLQSQNLWPRVSPLVQVQGFYTLQQTIRFRWYRFYALSHVQKLDNFISCYFPSQNGQVSRPIIKSQTVQMQFQKYEKSFTPFLQQWAQLSGWATIRPRKDCCGLPCTGKLHTALYSWKK